MIINKMKEKLEKLINFEQKIKIIFNNKQLLKEAFTHRSYINENRECDWAHNERLEFLGDAVLELVATEYLFSKYPQHTEGDLTSFRAALVNTQSISEGAVFWNMNDYLLLSKGESRDVGKARHSILANTFEAVIGAIYLDQGYQVTRDFISKSLFHKTKKIVEQELWKDAKSRLQEKAQEITYITPSYSIIKEVGPDHNKEFIVGVFIGDEMIAEGFGLSKQEAEQQAAEKALKIKKW
ncbi:ribonuclease III [Patescibacteria group bacterium]|nr:ribonuclease III [Patescibacteria group bacterium]MBU1246852.1 ribonuclease III [Patescibacteria group bacterium]MBU1519608.1 ribonuclease III [Patescibacteria group bacterium]MBU1730058.1 ribonuclease III [Patescibacteria group bacterium]MBU1956636.1 ribonuclease III [Patescibacteria group bacterium]